MASWSPKPEDLSRVFAEQNPWHQSGEVPSSLAYSAERPLGQLLWKRLLENQPRRFQVVLGPRRVGKSTVLYQTVRHLLAQGIDPARVWWLRLDHPVLLQQDLGNLVRHIADLTGATEARPTFVMVDELVYASQWDLWLKTFHDEQWPVRIAATSSATAALRNRRHESGVGRWEEQHLTPYLFPEFLDLLGQPAAHIEVGASLVDTIRSIPATFTPPPALGPLRRLFMLTGGFPELLTSIASQNDRDERDALLRSQQILRNDAVERAVYKDIPQSFGVDSPMMLERLLYVLAGQMGGVLAPTSLCSDLGLSQPTFDRYLTYLEQTFLVFTLPNYSGNEARVQRRGRKLYFVDGAIRNAALQRGLTPLTDPIELGALLENLVAASMRTLSLLTGTRLYYWRERQNEVDLILDQPGEPLAVEIASSATHHRRGLTAFVESHKRFARSAYLLAPNAAVHHPTGAGDDVGSLPTDAFLLAVGAHAARALDSNLLAGEPFR